MMPRTHRALKRGSVACDRRTFAKITERIEMLHNIVDLLVPELQRRGRFRTAYTGRTLRENLAT
jgi:hypothetical protein